VPGVDAAELAAYCLMLGDDALICRTGCRVVTRAPELEDEVALANIGLDLLGQARLLLTPGRRGRGRRPRRGRATPTSATAGEFRNVRLAELPDGDFAF
jgi:ring-1,2-phenylacetyl-CoA epoxidase subunit PaaC